MNAVAVTCDSEKRCIGEGLNGLLVSCGRFMEWIVEKEIGGTVIERKDHVD
jgi:hypothetical protein